MYLNCQKIRQLKFGFTVMHSEVAVAELQIRGGIEDNSKITFLISQ